MRRLEYRLNPKSPVTWLVGAAALCVGAVLAAFFFTAFLVAAVVGAIAAPFLVRRRRKQLERSPGGGRVIDAEYEVHQK